MNPCEHGWSSPSLSVYPPAQYCAFDIGFHVALKYVPASSSYCPPAFIYLKSKCKFLKYFAFSIKSISI